MHRAGLLAFVLMLVAGCAGNETETRLYTFRSQAEFDVVAARLNRANADDGLVQNVMEPRENQQALVAATPPTHRAIEALLADARRKEEAARAR